MSLNDRISDLFKRTERIKARELSESVVTHDRLDDGVLDDMVDRAAHFRTAMFDRPPEFENLTAEQQEEAQKYTFWEDLFGDTFRALHTYDNPELESSEDIKPSRELNRRIMSQVISADSFRELRPTTRHDELSSAFASIGLTDKLRDLLGEQLGEFMDRANEMGEKEEQIENAQEQIDAINEAIAEQDGEADEQQAEALAEAQQAQADAQQELAERAAEQETQGMGAEVVQAIDEAVDEANESANVISNLPGTEPGTGERLSPDEMIDLAQKWKDNWEMKQIAQMIGRLQRDIRYKRTNRIIGGREEIVDVKLGDELTLLLPMEKMKLRHPLLRRDFMRRFYERSLVQYETRGYAEAGRGPMIVCVDGSGSMRGMENVWARSVALSLISIAKREKRDAAAIEFSTNMDETKRWDFMANEPINPLVVTDFASHFFDGGTDITCALVSAKELIDTVPEFKQADIVLATDGHDRWHDDDDELHAEFVARGVRIHGVAIGMESNAWLERMCESVVSAWDLAGSNEATDHLAEVIT